MQLQNEIPWNSTVVLEVSFGTYGMRWPHDGPPMENAGVTAYLNAVRVLAWGEDSGGSTSVDDATLDALLDETEEDAAKGSAPVASAGGTTEMPEDPLPPVADDETNPEWEGY